MKRWSLSVGTYGGTEVRIHITFLMLLAFFAWDAMRRGGVSAAVEVLAFLIAMFTCVLLHEFGHVIAARRYGIRTPDITLLPIGGLARLERMPREPMQELIVAIAGPAVNVVIGLILLMFHGLVPFDEFMDELIRGSFTGRLMVWNFVMVGFNMIPAFPMDGGRVLRAVLAMFLDYGQATRVAATLGQGLAVIGAMVALLTPGYHLLPLLIALFIFMAAGQEAAYVTDQESMRGLRVRDAMVTNFRTLPHDAVLRDAVQLLLSGTQHDFPVLDENGVFRGMLGRTALISALAEHGAQHAVGTVTEPCETRLDPRHPLSEALEKLRASSCPALPVIDPVTGQLLGLLTTENIAEMIMVRTALAK
jgi:Zn-dependent protease/CBS domain-containing protein